MDLKLRWPIWNNRR